MATVRRTTNVFYGPLGSRAVSSFSQEVLLRDVRQDDVPIFFAHQLEPEADYMIALSTRNPHDERSFTEQWQRIFDSDAMMAKTVEANGLVAGYVASFKRLGKLEVSYWLGSYFWGRGLATASLLQFLSIQNARPIFARVAKDNPASFRVLEKCGFVIHDESSLYGNADGQEVEESVMVLKS